MAARTGAGAIRAAVSAARTAARSWAAGGARTASEAGRSAVSGGGAAASPRAARSASGPGAAELPEAFRGAAAKVISQANWAKYNAPYPDRPVGPPENSFVAPLAPMVSAVATAPPGGVLPHMEKAMGLDAGALESGAVFAAIYDGAEQRKLPDGSEGGANQHFVAGGATSGGMPEAVQPGSSREEHFYMPFDQEGVEAISAVRTMDLEHMATASRVARYLGLAQSRAVDENDR